MALHFDKIISIHDECPIILCFSSSCGTGILACLCYHYRQCNYCVLFSLPFVLLSGKTLTLKAILSLFGLGENSLQRGRITTEALLRFSAVSCVPVAVDDISSAVKMEDIAVTYFNAAQHTTVAGGTVRPRGTIVVSSNQSFVESDRLARPLAYYYSHHLQ